jgi:hypothetical protein
LNSGYLPIPDAFDKDGRAVIIIRTAAHDPNKYTQEEMFKCSLMLLEIFMRDVRNMNLLISYFHAADDPFY